MFIYNSFWGEVMKINTKMLIYLIVLAILDMIIPIPFTALILIYVILEKPPWFIKWVTEIYKEPNGKIRRSS
jgi:hypothetical protein